jgi:hypothetical protein
LAAATASTWLNARPATFHRIRIVGQEWARLAEPDGIDQSLALAF